MSADAGQPGPLSVEEALARITADAAPLPLEMVAIGQAHGRTLAAPLAARLTQPPFDASAMDGYAVRAVDVTPAPTRLAVIGELRAGSGYHGTVGPGQAVRIFTGAPVPAGADAIVIQEDTDRQGATVIVNDGSIDAGYIRRRGFDFVEGRELLSPGRRLNAREVVLAAAMGHGEVPVIRRPRVAILATGDELVPPGITPGADQIVCSNTYGIAAMLAAAGAEPSLLGIAADTREALKEKLTAARSFDVLVTVGGASVGDHDLVGPVLAEMGLALDFWKIAMRPGKPLMFGRLAALRVVGLPGNPVSSMICARVFLVPLIRRLAGIPDIGPDTRKARLTAAMPANGPRQHYARAVLESQANGETTARPVRSQDSSLMLPLAEANALIVQPPHAPAWTIGTEVTVLAMDF